MSEDTQQPNANSQQHNQPASTALAPVQNTLAQTPQSAQIVSPFSNDSAFIAAQRMAKALASSNIVPEAYRGNIPNCLIAMEVASRIGVSVLAVMQNMDIIYGQPSFRAKFLIATVNASGKFSPIRFEWGGEAGKPSWACRAKAKSKEDGEMCVGPWITLEMAIKEGWTTKKGSKWQTMAELMFCNRAATLWSRLYCPEISIGFQTSDELYDQHGVAVDDAAPLPANLTPGSASSLEAVLGLQKQAVVDMPADETPAPKTPESLASTAVSGQIEMSDTAPKKGK